MPQPVAHVLVVDEDDTVVSGLFKTMLRSEQASEFVRAEETDRAGGTEIIDDGGASALLVIPAGFQDAVLRESPAQLELVTNPAEKIRPMIVTVGVEVLVDAVFYLHRILGDELRKIVESAEGDAPPTDEAIAEISVGINRVMRKVDKYVSPAGHHGEGRGRRGRGPGGRSASGTPDAARHRPDGPALDGSRDSAVMSGPRRRQAP